MKETERNVVRPVLQVPYLNCRRRQSKKAIGMVKSQGRNEDEEKLGETRTTQKCWYSHKKEQMGLSPRARNWQGEEKEHQIQSGLPQPSHMTCGTD